MHKSFVSKIRTIAIAHTYIYLLDTIHPTASELPRATVSRRLEAMRVDSPSSHRKQAPQMTPPDDDDASKPATSRNGAIRPFLNCMPHAKCITCFATMQADDVDWASVPADTPCPDVIKFLSAKGKCTDLQKEHRPELHRGDTNFVRNELIMRQFFQDNSFPLRHEDSTSLDSLDSILDVFPRAEANESINPKRLRYAFLDQSLYVSRPCPRSIRYHGDVRCLIHCSDVVFVQQKENSTDATWSPLWCCFGFR